MSGGGSKPGEHRGGRVKGTPNKYRGQSRDRYRVLAHKAEPWLLEIAQNSPSDAARVSAIKEINDRAYGRAPQPLSGEGGDGEAVIRVITGVDRADGPKELS